MGGEFTLHREPEKCPRFKELNVKIKHRRKHRVPDTLMVTTEGKGINQGGKKDWQIETNNDTNPNKVKRHMTNWEKYLRQVEQTKG